MILTPDRLELNGIDINEMDDSIHHRVLEANKDDGFYNNIRDAITEGSIKYQGITLSKCFIQDGALYHLDRLWVSEAMHTEVIREVHDQPACEYLGLARTYELVRREYYWRGMKSIITQYVRNCYTCHRVKPSRDREHGLLKPLPVPQKRWQDITMDYVTGLLESDGCNAILTIVDRLTKERHYVPCIAAEKGTSAETTAGLLIREVFRIHGLPASIISDRGPQFVATIWKSFYERLRIRVKLSTAFHLETDK